MKSLALVLVVLVAAAAAAPDVSRRSLERRDSSANINDYMDRVLEQTKVFLVENNLDPYTLTEHYLYNFTFKDLLGIKWKTRLGLFDGQCRNLTTIQRSGDAQLSYTSDKRSLNLQAAVTFDRIEVSYTYAAQTLNLGPAGVFTAIVKNLNANLEVEVNLRTFSATLHDFSVNSAKSIKVDVTGLTLLGNLGVEAFVNTFLLILKGPILNVIEGQVKAGLTAGIAGVDAKTFLSSYADDSS